MTAGIAFSLGFSLGLFLGVLSILCLMEWMGGGL